MADYWKGVMKSVSIFSGVFEMRDRTVGERKKMPNLRFDGRTAGRAKRNTSDFRHPPPLIFVEF
jgi:hypothetical protein